MHCDTYAEWISAQLDGELEAAHGPELDRHLADCATCRRTRQTLERLAAATRALPRRQPADRAIIAVNEALHRLAPAPRRSDFGPVMDIEELAEFLRVTPETIGTYLDELPSFELGGKLLFRRASVEKWIEQREQSIQLVDAPSLLTVRSSQRGIAPSLAGQPIAKIRMN